MNTNAFPTKGNLMLAKNSLALAKQGYELMDKKRNILIRELMNLIEEAKNIQTQIDSTFTEAYQALQQANIEVGIHYVQQIAQAVPVENGVRIKTRSIMGTEIPLVEHEEEKKVPYYGFYNSSESVDAAREGFLKVKELTLKLSMVENSAYRLAMNIRKTQKRANALKNITIPAYTVLVKDISNALDEKDREEFTRLKVVKRMVGDKNQ
ncbi:MAG TPA: V-type ATP synthase subunit D [Candidatus Eisenbergiella intestinipullorum]|nr:V-type ATP synthase subunit D [Candidatus Eisenbergiella intestinipullorum]